MNKKLLLTLPFLAGLFLIASCKKDAKIDAPKVFVSTNPVTNIAAAAGNTTSITATGGGEIAVVNNQPISERGFVWDTDTLPTTAKHKAVAGSGAGHFDGSIPGLVYGKSYHLRAYVISSGTTYYGNDVKFLASVPLELIMNGNFELPADPNVVTINQTTNWKTDETDNTIIGRGTDPRNPTEYAWMRSSAKSFYQVVGTVPSDAADFAIKFDGNYDWTDWGNGYNTNLCVRFSSYTGSDPTKRKTIDSVIIQTGGFPGYGNNWGPMAGSFSLPAGSAHAGENFVIEFALLPYNGGEYDDGAYYDFDNISVIQTLK